MNDTSIVIEIERPRVVRQIGRREVSRVDAFEAHDAGIGSQLPVELVRADVDRHHAARAAREQDVRESAGRGADVERDPAGRRRGRRPRARAPASRRRVRPTDDPVVCSSIVAVSAMRRAGFGHRHPVDACTSPARMSARARSRVATRPRATIRTSRRVALTGVRALFLPRQAPVGDLRQPAAQFLGGERRLRALDALDREAARGLDAVERRETWVCPAAASLPAVLPRPAFDPSTSSTSSMIWNARPRSRAYASIAAIDAVVRAGHDGADGRRGADERAGLAQVHVLERREHPWRDASRSIA